MATVPHDHDRRDAGATRSPLRLYSTRISALRKVKGAGFIGVYGVAHGGKSLVWQLSETLFAFFLTEACGLEPATMGWVLGASLIVNAFADLLVGTLLAHRIRSVASAGVAQWAGALSACAALVLFSLSGLVPEPARLAYAAILLMLFRLAYALFDNPQNAMLALASGDDGGRVRLTVVRYVASGLTSLLIALVAVPFVRARDAGVQSIHFAGFAICLACIAVLSARLLERYSRSPAGLPITGIGGTFAKAEHRGPPLASTAVFVIILVFAFCGSVFGKLLPYFTAFASHSVAMGGTLMMSDAVGRFLSQFFWGAFAQRRPLAGTLRVALLCWAAGATFFLAVFLGFSGLVYGVGSGGILMCLWALAASASHAENVPSTAIYGGLTFCSKIGHAGSLLAIALILGQTHYREAPAFLRYVTPYMGAVPLAGAAVCLAIMLVPGLPPLPALLVRLVRRTGA
jgi:GPH family glycoside/pentoside/hexuronide:cation symporter